ncbi:MotA/TolQ/ExbB proton channel family protein [Helicobacter zhangjianzhongii]|uniref:MotA/TolQ/ExbB proton channel family protein n=1 Tax=Helicobacter zhangjianzhongii TaxID=2974574 RepID=A0ACC6FSH5_9HELI|nr:MULTISPECIES: MotA/TolQ/ExbB proton channel family protein [unclassified Helicobacter]MDL0079752.1 MotA/TolQ/ExbB proton channel family protein [Helicobacter sp. CPD2-1]MDL0082153.1 MotA/TolQ/ExbB proton channel family protein [Helicobacter sp. XJK30-2]
MGSVFQFLEESSLITLLTLCWLSAYCFATLWIFFYKYISLAKMVKDEQDSLEAILQGEQRFPRDAIFISADHRDVSPNIFSLWKNKAIKHSTTGLAFLSIIASTSPFIGLFGTVVEILDAFGRLGNSGQVSFDVIAPVISKALVATAAGILTAIPAYTFFMILKRKVYDLGVYIQMQIDYLSSAK